MKPRWMSYSVVVLAVACVVGLVAPPSALANTVFENLQSVSISGDRIGIIKLSHGGAAGLGDESVYSWTPGSQAVQVGQLEASERNFVSHLRTRAGGMFWLEHSVRLDFSDGDGGIFRWRGGESAPSLVVTHSAPVHYMNASGGRVVWGNSSDFEYSRLYTWKEGEAAPQLIADPKIADDPDVDDPGTIGVARVSGDRIVWPQGVVGKASHNLFTWKAGDTSPTKVRSASEVIGACYVSGDRVVWRELARTGDGPSDYHWSLYTQLVGEDSPRLLVRTRPGNDRSWNKLGGRISGDRLVWRAPVDHESGQKYWQVFTWRPGDAAPSQLTTDAVDHARVRVSGDNVVWMSYPPGHFRYQLSRVHFWSADNESTTELTPDPIECSALAISDDRVVWIQGAYQNTKVMTWSAGDAQAQLVMDTMIPYEE